MLAHHNQFHISAEGKYLMTSIRRVTALIALMFALACGSAASPNAGASPGGDLSAYPTGEARSGDSPAAGSTNQLDKVKQTNTQDTANKAPGKKKEMSRAGSPAASSNTANGPATSQPSAMAEKKEEAPGSLASAGGIEPISDEQAVEELRRAGISTSGWDTNFNLRSVDYDDILGGGPNKDGIPAIDAPIFQTVTEADEWLDGREPVQVVHIDGDARAYPMQIMMFHEIVNDTVGGEPVVITY